MKIEDLRPIPNQPGYFASRFGEIISNRSGKYITLSQTRHSKYKYLIYRCKDFSRKDNKIHKSVRRSIALAWHGDPGPGFQVSHIGLDKSDNSPNNLTWIPIPPKRPPKPPRILKGHKLVAGKRFGMLTAIEPTDKPNIWKYKCDCGNVIIDNVHKNKKSCGCLLHRHGKSRSRVYKIWAGIKKRCLNPRNPAFKHYGGRGISICERWLSFENFLADMGEPPDGLSIDRIDNDKGYSPENCRWADWKTQHNNRRGNVIIEYNGERKTISQWADTLGISAGIISGRYRSGYELDIVFGIKPLRIPKGPYQPRAKRAPKRPYQPRHGKRGRKNFLSKEQMVEALSLHKQGTKIKDIAAKFGVGYGVVYSFIFGLSCKWFNKDLALGA